MFIVQSLLFFDSHRPQQYRKCIHCLHHLHQTKIKHKITAKLVEVFVKSGDITYTLPKYLHHFKDKFEHEFSFGGGSGDSGGIFL
jgi:hypothetical protein